MDELIIRKCLTCSVTVLFSESDNSHLSFWANHLGHKVVS